jgi:hypothetical protein
MIPGYRQIVTVTATIAVTVFLTIRYVFKDAKTAVFIAKKVNSEIVNLEEK